MYKENQEVKINGSTFIVVKVRKFNVVFAPDRSVERYAVTLRRPKGKRTYEMIVYENDTYSSIV